MQRRLNPEYIKALTLPRLAASLVCLVLVLAAAGARAADAGFCPLPDPYPPTDPGAPGPGPGDGDTCPANTSCVADPVDPGTGDPATCSAPSTGSVADPRPATGTNNPINLISGNKYKRQADIEPLPGALAVEFVRHYNSNLRQNRGLGVGWTHSYDLQVTGVAKLPPAEQEWVVLVQADGRLVEFSRSPAARAAGEPLRPVYGSDGVLHALASGYRWDWHSGRALHFDEQGLLRRIEQGARKIYLKRGADGRLLSAADDQDRAVSLRYTDGYLAAVSGPDGAQTEYRYTREGQLLEVHRPDGRVRRYQYRNPHGTALLTGIVDESGKTIGRYDYDKQGRAIASSKGDGVEAVTVRYEAPDDSGHRRTTVTDADGLETHYRIAPVPGRNGQRRSMVLAVSGAGCNACGVTAAQYDYNDRLQVSAQTDANGVTTSYEYDAQGRVTHAYRQQADGQRELLRAFRYDGDSRQPSQIDRPSLVAPGQVHGLQIEYSPTGRVARLIERGFKPATPLDSDAAAGDTGAALPIERTLSFAYDRADNLTEIDGYRTDVDDRVRLEYNPRNQLVAVRRPSGETISVLAHDAAGRPLEIARGDADPVRFLYRSDGQPVEISQGALTLRYEYDDADNLVAMVDANGIRTAISYDAADRPVTFERQHGARARLTYDAQNRLVADTVTDRRGAVIRSLRYIYDAERRLAAIDGGAGEVPLALGDGSNPDDALLHLAQVEAQLRITRADGSQVALAKDARGNRVAVTDPNGNRTERTLDDFGHTIIHASPATGTRYYARDAAGNAIAQLLPGGLRRDASFDADNRLLTRSNGSDTLTYEYDPVTGQVARVSSKEGHETFRYDRNARLIAHERVFGGVSLVTGYRYDARGRLEEKTLPDGQGLRFRYYEDGENAGQLRAVSQLNWFGLSETSLVGELDRNAWDGRQSMTYGNGVSRVTTHDQRGQIEAIELAGAMKLSYRYDEQGYIVGLAHDDTRAQYAYSAAGRLSQARISQAGDSAPTVHSYRYDPAGNRLEATRERAGDVARTRYSYAGAGNRLTAIDGQPVTYNEQGSPVAQASSRGTLRYEYDANQRPIRLFVNDRLTAEYGYNAFGERVRKTLHGTGGEVQTVYYLYEGTQLTAEVAASGTVLRQYVYVDAHPVAALIDGETYFLHTDQAGTPYLATDDRQQVVWRASYDPFGAATVEAAAIELNLRLPGQFEDQESGTHYNYFRDYNPATGRYQTSDPTGLRGGLNTYAYAFNDPIALNDPLGLSPFGSPGGAGQPGKPAPTLTPSVDASIAQDLGLPTLLRYGDTVIEDFAATGPRVNCSDQERLMFEIGLSLLSNNSGRPAIVYGDTADEILNRYDATIGGDRYWGRLGSWVRNRDELQYLYPDLNDEMVQELALAIRRLPGADDDRIMLAIPRGATDAEIAAELRGALGDLITDEDIAAFIDGLPSRAGGPLLVDIRDLYEEVLTRFQTRLHDDERVWAIESRLNQVAEELARNEADYGSCAGTFVPTLAGPVLVPNNDPHCEARREFRSDMESTLEEYYGVLAEVHEELTDDGLLPLMDQYRNRQNQARDQAAAITIATIGIFVPLSLQDAAVDAATAGLGRLARVGRAAARIIEGARGVSRGLIRQMTDAGRAAAERVGLRRADIRERLLVNGEVPSVRNGAFNEWFDNLSPRDLDQLWGDEQIRATIGRRIRQPGELHEWCMVCRTPTFKRWGVSMDELKRFRTGTEELVWTHPVTGVPGGHRIGEGSGDFHNELKAIIDNSQSLEQFNRGVTDLVQRWQIDPSLLPPLITR